MALCKRCGEEIALANDLDQDGDIDWRRHRVMVAGKPRSLTATHWQIFMLLYQHRGDVVSIDRIHVELSKAGDHASAEPIREHMLQLRKVLAGSRYQIVNYRTLGYELVVSADTSDALAAALAQPPERWQSEMAWLVRRALEAGLGSLNRRCISLPQRSP